MKWHKKMCDHLDWPFTQELLFEFGAQGYLVYWAVIAYIGKENNYGEVTGEGTVNARILKQKVHVSLTKVKEILDFCQRKVELSYSYDGENFKFQIPKLLEILDNYEANLQAEKKLLANKKEKKKKKKEGEEENPISMREKFADDDYKRAVWMYEKIKNSLPNFKEPNFDTWAYEINLLVRIDGKSHTEIENVFSWANEDSFWRANILSPQKLRKQWDQLEAQMLRDKKEVESESEPDNEGADFYRKINAEMDAKEQTE